MHYKNSNSDTIFSHTYEIFVFYFYCFFHIPSYLYTDSCGIIKILKLLYISYNSSRLPILFLHIRGHNLWVSSRVPNPQTVAYSEALHVRGRSCTCVPAAQLAQAVGRHTRACVASSTCSQAVCASPWAPVHLHVWAAWAHKCTCPPLTQPGSSLPPNHISKLQRLGTPELADIHVATVF